jgi:hypothetical protein
MIGKNSQDSDQLFNFLVGKWMLYIEVDDDFPIEGMGILM